MNLPQFTLHDYQTAFAGRHLLHNVVSHWALHKPEAPALIAADGSRTVTWSEFDRQTSALAAQLSALGLAKGDFLVTMLPMSVDHVLLEYGCFKIGVIVAPLDLRLSPAEVMRALSILKPRAFAALGLTPPFDFRELWRTVQNGVQDGCPSISTFIAVGSSEPISGAHTFAHLLDAATRSTESVSLPAIPISEDDGALVIFTTGSTGSPKPALLSHKGITVQNMCLCGAFFGGDRGTSILVNLPASHVGGQTEELMSVLFGGGAAVLLDFFDPARSLRAIAQHRVEILGQIPVMFSLEWMLKDYAAYDLSSLKFVAYGGNAVSRPFLDRMAQMAPLIGTGLGLTEASGWCTYVQAGNTDKEAIVAGLGVDMPIYRCSIRQPMRQDGHAGDELPPGQIGHVCFHGPQNFLGYVNDPEATARTLSQDGFLYTGDLGFYDAAGLHLTGREKWVIKSFGYQIFPGDIESHVAQLADKVLSCVVVGVPHAVVYEAPVALVEKRAGIELTVAELDRHARTLAPYQRPRHWILLDPGQMPLNRIAKPDYLRAQQIARQAIDELRARGNWDSNYLAAPQPGE